MSKTITPAQSFFGEKIYPYVNEIYNYALMINNYDHIAEKQLTKSCKDAAWFSEYLSPGTDTRIWLFRIMMKIVEDQNPQDNTNSNDLSLTEQTIDFLALNEDIFEKENQYATSKKIRDTIAKLPYNLKQALILTDLLKFDYNQASDLIDIPEGTLLIRLFDARKLLLLNLTSELSPALSEQKLRISYKDKKMIISLYDEQKNNDQHSTDKTKFSNEIEIQQYIKSLLEKYISLQPIRQAVKERIIKKFAPHLKNELNNSNTSSRKNFVTVATIVMFALAAILIILNRPEIADIMELTSQQQGENNILIQLKKNYDSTINHRFDSLLIKVDPGTINNDLENVLPGDEPVFLILNDWYPTNYFITKFEDHKLINLLYKNESNSILITLQVPLKYIGQEKPFNLTVDLLNYLKSENCFVTRQEDDIYLLKIIGNNILGVAGQNLDKNVLLNICNQKML